MLTGQSAAQILSSAEQAVSSITDPVLKQAAFQRAIELSTVSSSQRLEVISRTIQILSVIVGVIISVLSFNAARRVEAQTREAEAAKPFLELRQKLYLEAVQVAAVLTNQELHSEQEIAKAKSRFRDLYIAELSLVEGFGVEQGMVGLAAEVDPELTELNDQQLAAYNLAHALRNSLVKSWNLNETLVDNPNK